MTTASGFLHFEVKAVRHNTSIEEANQLWLLKITLRWRRLLQLRWFLYTSWSWSAIGLWFILTSWAIPALCIFRVSALFPKLWKLWLHLKLLGHRVLSPHSLRANWILGHRTLSAFGDSTSLGSAYRCWNHQILKLILDIAIVLTTFPIWIHSSHSSIFDLLMPCYCLPWCVLLIYLLPLLLHIKRWRFRHKFLCSVLSDLRHLAVVSRWGWIRLVRATILLGLRFWIGSIHDIEVD